MHINSSEQHPITATTAVSRCAEYKRDRRVASRISLAGRDERDVTRYARVDRAGESNKSHKMFKKPLNPCVLIYQVENVHCTWRGNNYYHLEYL